MGLELLKRCDEIWVMGFRFSEGMRGEMELAAAENIPILYIPESFVRCGYKIRQEDKAFSEADCIPGSNKMDYTNQILVLKPEAYGGNAEITADDSLWLAEHGNGCRYGARGLMVMAVKPAVRQTGPLGAAGLFRHRQPRRLLEWSADKPVCNDRAQEILDLAEQEFSVPEEEDDLER